jgi:ATP-dependent Lon protease
MRGVQSRWPHPPAEPGDYSQRHLAEFSHVNNSLIDDEGLIEAFVLPLRDLVFFPNMVTPLFLDPDQAQSPVQDVLRGGETLIAITQRKLETAQPGPKDLYRLGTEIAVGRLQQNSDGGTSVLAQGRRRIEVVEYVSTEPLLRVRGRPILEPERRTQETAGLMRAALGLFDTCVQLNRSLPEEAYVYALNIEQPGWLADLVASTLPLPISERQKVLEILDPVKRLNHVSELLRREVEVLELEDLIHNQVQSEVNRSQREDYLREQMKAIQTELGEGDLWTQELAELRKKIEEKALPEEVAERATREFQRLGQMPPLSPEVGIIRTYLDWILELPWKAGEEKTLDLRSAARTLNREHYGLRKAKDRILEYIAVRQLAGQKQRQPILCFVGPPGTGKTSLGKSIAKALGREFVRISLGGIRDEAEIRGHRRTYIGALPGRILQALRRCGTSSPLFMLDEIEKLGLDYRGDPAAALLEVLDPEQNHAFSDHYLEIPYDLSHVLFITTANTTESIPPALLDRMEIVEFPGYIEEEKLLIAEKFLVGRQLAQNGLTQEELSFAPEALRRIIREYTWEAGVRNLEREIGKICRKIARRKAEVRPVPTRIEPPTLGRLLGPPPINPHRAERQDQVGSAIGVAWTENGGETMPVEVLLVEGKGNVQITGQVGEVMQESAQAALSYVKSRAAELGVEAEIFESHDIHIHIPEGSIPKDGPSAGITIATALASALTGRPVRRDLGMSGEITLRGRVLPIGGVREKFLAAYRLPLRTVILPAQNRKDLVDIPKQARRAVHVELVSHMDQVLALSLLPPRKGRRRPVARKSGSGPSAAPPTPPAAQ